MAAALLEGESKAQELLLREWERQQMKLKEQMIDHDTEDWQSNEVFEGLERIGGVDLSYIKGDEVNACASLVVLSYPDLKVIYEECQMVCLTAPYIPGFLAFRETPFLEEALRRLQHKDPSLLPQVIFADGNGILHHREFGVACHLGVLTDLPCVGVAKNLLHVSGLEEKDSLKEKAKDLQKEGNAFSLIGSSGKVLGMALKSCEKSTKPIYVSVGHRISLDTALRLTHSCCKYRVPEPIRQVGELRITFNVKLLDEDWKTFRVAQNGLFF
ncbi:endonuclease V-like isoform X1 [Hemiscyllium ocellatum]|uniref:endonuclease V-like isoform X1 n=1 Tax=Hemiscyllium ocellatum TaxID=170820 RepID=UPI0029667A62|nr:endonuclease V-like isoform X1 [Hemiscyllium ocellatum]